MDRAVPSSSPVTGDFYFLPLRGHVDPQLLSDPIFLLAGLPANVGPKWPPSLSLRDLLDPALS